MATTTKTLTPTNQTITLPDMTERPNASVLVDGIGKDADAINALSEQIANFIVSGNCPYESNWRGADGRYLRFVLIRDSNGHGICTVNGLADNQQAITAGTSYVVSTLPVTSLRDAVAFTNAGKWSIAYNSNELKFTPNSNMGAYVGDLMSIAFAI